MTERSSIFLVSCLVSGILAKSSPVFLEYQDSLGRYSFGYSAPGSARSEVRSADGSTRGYYSYVDGAGIIQSARYTADGENGFQVVATNLPEAPNPVEDTPEVTAARFNHLRALEAAAKLANDGPEESEKNDETMMMMKKVVDAVIIENADDKIDSQTQARVAANNESLSENSEKSDEAKSNEKNEAIAKNARDENEKGSMEITKDSSKNYKQNQLRARTSVSNGPDVPLVTTSFVIPGTVNLHTRVELDQSGAAAARINPGNERAKFSATSASSMYQGGNSKSASLTPAGTRIMMKTDETMATSGSMTPLPEPQALEPMPMTLINDKQQKYSETYLPGFVATPNIFALTYGVGVDPINHQYNPFQYFPYGVL